MKRSFRLLVTALLVAAAPLVQAPSVRASALPEIPGTPLVGRSVTGSVGGAVVDEVYSVSLQEGVIVTVSLSGAQGAELGLYLFAPGATSILEDDPIALSAKPGAVQAVSVVTEVSGTYFLNVNGRNTSRAYGYTLTLVTQRDDTPPVFERALGAFASRSDNVCVYVKATDAVSGVQDLQVSASGDFTAAPWLEYRGTDWYCADLEMTEGAGLVYLRARNGVGGVSAVRSVSVLIDDTNPLVLSTDPAQDGLMLEPRGSVSWRLSEPIRLTEVGAEAVFAVSQLGMRIPGSVQLSTNRRRVIWTPSVSIRPGTTLLLSLRSVRDAAGNESGSSDSLIIERKRPVSLAVELLGRGEKAVRLGFDVSAVLAGKALELELRLNGDWSPFRSYEVVGGVDVVRIPLSEIGEADRFRLRWLGDETLAPAVSSGVRLTP